MDNSLINNYLMSMSIIFVKLAEYLHKTVNEWDLNNKIRKIRIINSSYLYVTCISIQKSEIIIVSKNILIFSYDGLIKAHEKMISLSQNVWGF